MHNSGKYLYSCSDDKSICVWDMITGKPIRRMADAHNHFISSLAINQKYFILATASYDLHIKIWELI